MAYLPLANIMHHKLRGLLSAAGIGIGICMLVTLSGLSRGSLYEISDRWEAVAADLIVYPRAWGENITTMSGPGISDKYASKLPAEHPGLIERVVPVFIWPMKFAGQNHSAACLDTADLDTLTGGRDFVAGRAFRPKTTWKQFVDELLRRKTAGLPAGQKKDFVLEITGRDLAEGGWLELVMDSRLARAGGFSVGQSVHAAGHDWKIVGITPAGAMTRLLLPRKTAQFLFGSGDTTRSTLMFVKLAAGADIAEAAGRIRTLQLEALPTRQYRAMLEHRFGIMFTYVDAVNAVALVIAFLFVMTTLYTMVLQRTREIAILKSCGAGGWFIIRQVIAESIILTAGGAAMGIAMSFAAARAIEHFKPLLTVRISWNWIALAAGAAAAGAIISSLYPAWRATRVDMVEALSYE